MHIVFTVVGALLLVLGLGAIFVSKGAVQEAASAGVAVLGAVLLVGGFAMSVLEDIRRQLKDLTLIVLGQCKAPEPGRLNSDRADRIASAVERTYRS
jgi:hypothetical protein